MLTSGTLAIEELAQHTKELKTKAERRAGNKLVQKFRVISLRGGRYRAAQRIEAEVCEQEMKAELRAKRVEAEMAKIDHEIEIEIAKEEKERREEATQEAKQAKKTFVVAVDLGPAPNFGAWTLSL